MCYPFHPENKLRSCKWSSPVFNRSKHEETISKGTPVKNSCHSAFTVSWTSLKRLLLDNNLNIMVKNSITHFFGNCDNKNNRRKIDT